MTMKTIRSSRDRWTGPFSVSLPTLSTSALALQLALSSWGCSAQSPDEWDAASDLGSVTQALDSVDANENNCDCGGESECECNETSTSSEPTPSSPVPGTTVIADSWPPDVPEGIADPDDLLPSDGPSQPPVASDGSTSTGGGSVGLARAVEACKNRLVREKNKAHAAVEAALSAQITVIQMAYTTALESEEDSYQNQLNGCGDTISCLLNVEANHRSAALLLLSQRDGSLALAQATASAGHQTVSDNYNAAVGQCVP